MRLNQFASLFFAICSSIVLSVPILLDIKGKDAVAFLGVAVILFGVALYSFGMAMIDSKMEKWDIKQKNTLGNKESERYAKRSEFLEKKIP